MAVLVVGSLVLAQALYYLHPLSPALEVYGAKQADLPASVAWAFHYVTAQEGQRLSGAGVRVFDVRGRTDYDQMHAAGAVSLPYHELDALLDKGWDWGARCVIYTYDTDSPLALKTAGEFDPSPDRIRIALVRIYVIYGGFDEWQADGLPVEKGPGKALKP